LNTDIFYFFTWYLLATAAGLAALPLLFKFFRFLPGRGYALARPFGLLVIGYLFWLLGSLGFLQNDSTGILAAAVIVALAGTAWTGRGGLLELRDWLKAEWRAVIGIELVFLLAFAGWALVRAYNPEILGTEKPMEFMFLNAILRSPDFPLRDAWLSGHAISYYYFGYLLAAMFSRLSAVPSAVGFNLSLALWFAMSATAALGVVMDMIALVQSGKAARQSTEEGAVPPPGRTLPRQSRLAAALPGALLAPLFLLLTGNLYGALGLANNNGLFARLEVPAIYYDFSQGDAGGNGLERMPGLGAGMVNFWEWLDLKQLPAYVEQPESPRFDLWNWFYAARVLHDRDLAGNEVEAIDENPAFSFLLGDLHPHVLALPFVLMAAALALEGLLWSRTLPGDMKRVDGLARLSLAGVLLGSTIPLNTWDFPFYAFLFALALIAGALAHEGGGERRDALKRSAPVLAGVLAAALVLYLPFLITFQSQAGGILPNVMIPTRFRQLLVMFAPVLAAVSFFLGWLWVQMRGAFQRTLAWNVAAGLLAILILTAAFLTWAALQLDTARPYIDVLLSPFSIGQAVSLSLQRRLVDSLAAISMAALVGICAGLLAAMLPEKDSEDTARHERSPLFSPALWMALLMVAVGALLVLGPEFLYLRDNFGTRMNTLFKFYFQAWVLWSLAGAFGAWLVFRLGSRRARVGMVCLVGSLVLLGLLYLPAGLWSKTGGFRSRPTLDGMAYFAQRYPDDWAAIEWLKANAPPEAVILEGSRGAYWLEGPSSRISMATGLPTVLGWANHERQWRGKYYDQVAGREDDLRKIYQLRDWQETSRLLDKYRVEYVVISDQERGWHRPLQEAKFAAGMREVFRAGNLVIYQR
jgi:YYY domain-containing protein